MLHGSVSKNSPPCSVQFFPPLTGEGLLQFLTRVFCPPPQVWLQLENWLHSLQPPSTATENVNIILLDCSAHHSPPITSFTSSDLGQNIAPSVCLSIHSLTDLPRISAKTLGSFFPKFSIFSLLRYTCLISTDSYLRHWEQNYIQG